jgi:hypothetical protein
MLKKAFYFLLKDKKDRDISKGSLNQPKTRIILWDEDTEMEIEPGKKKKK